MTIENLVATARMVDLSTLSVNAPTSSDYIVASSADQAFTAAKAQDAALRTAGKPGFSTDDMYAEVRKAGTSALGGRLLEVAVVCVATDVVARLNGLVVGYKNQHAVPRGRQWALGQPWACA